MSIILAVGLLAAAPVEPVLSLEHRTRVEHGSGAVEAHYRTRVSLAHRQVGTAGKPGTASSLRCTWRADIALEREARHGSGSVLSRTLARQGAITGSRPGWCASHRAAIAKEVAAREEEFRGHAVILAQEDEAQLRAELARIGQAG